MYKLLILSLVCLCGRAFASWTRIPFVYFYPPGVVEITKKSKPELPVGILDPSSQAARTRDNIEAIPIELRLDIIDFFIALSNGKVQSVNTDPQFDTIRMVYINHIRKLSTIDPGIYRLLAGYAAKLPDLNPEMRIDSASGIIEKIQMKFPNGEFDHMTPEYNLDWYALIGGSSLGRVRGSQDPTIREKLQLNTLKIYADSAIVLDLYPDAWREMLRKRRYRLVTYGYESLP